MKKKMQKYLSGSNEGFSLVELIIVIAIMAILVGVVALAVIPNLERSRESKDLTTLDNVASALATGVANAGGGAGQGKITDVTALSKVDDPQSAEDKVGNGIVEALGADAVKNIKLVSSVAGTDAKVSCEWDSTDGKTMLKVYAGDGTIECKYQKDDDGKPRKLVVEK